MGRRYTILLASALGVVMLPNIPSAQTYSDHFPLVWSNDPADGLWSMTGDGVRSVIAGSDLDQDGHYEVIATDYEQGGRVHVFEATGNDQLQLVWSSPGLGDGTPYHCRFVQTGDLDGDGKQEVIVAISEDVDNASSLAGLYVYEWDGTTDNGYGSASVSYTPVLSNVNRFRCEHFLVADVDGDLTPEVILAINGSFSDDYFVILSVAGSFELGTATWNEELRLSRGALFDGDAENVLISDMDGDGNREVVCHIWNNMTALVAEATGADTYSVGQAYQFGLGNKNDVCLLNGAVADFDGDGKDEVYFNGWKTGNLYVLTGGDDATLLDASKVSVLSIGGLGGGWQAFGMAVGDQDGTASSSSDDLYIGTSGVADVYQFHFLGGSVTDSMSYELSIIYVDSSDGGAITSRLATPSVDLDGDGNREIVVGYQSIPDSVSTKKWLRMLEFDPSSTPVELASFEAAERSGSVVLSWETVSETNNYGFEVQRRRPREAFGTIAFVQGHGTSNSSHSYRFVDNVPFWGSYLYRLKQIDTDGTFELSGEVAVSVGPNHAAVVATSFPNPFNSSTTITFSVPPLADQPDASQQVAVEVFDVTGRMVRELLNAYRLPGNYELPWHGLDKSGRQVPSGVYFYRVVAGPHRYIGKMILAK